MEKLTEAIALCLNVHAVAVDRIGTAEPELDPKIPEDLRTKIQRQRLKVDRTLSGDPAVHRAHVLSLTKGLRIVLSKLVEPTPKPSKPPAPKWDDRTKRWIQP